MLSLYFIVNSIEHLGMLEIVFFNLLTVETTCGIFHPFRLLQYDAIPSGYWYIYGDNVNEDLQWPVKLIESKRDET